MNLKSVQIKNFRGFTDTGIIPISETITGIIGKNDVGKSSILDALAVFFGTESVKLDKDDFNKRVADPEIEITCYFDNIPEDVIIDATNPTNLAEEYLLHSSGELVIQKIFKKTKLKEPSTINLLANHPTLTNYHDLHSLKMTELKKRVNDLKVSTDDIGDERMSSNWRKCIWRNSNSLNLTDISLDISKFSTESKSIYENLSKFLPLFELFKSDRESTDGDPVAKNPLQEAVKAAQRDLQVDIDVIERKIKEKVIERTQKTLEKLQEMDPELAKTLDPVFKTPPKWTFDFNLDGDDSIPVNKRGSGVRRLILLNFFRAEAERKITETNSPSVIYAFEEPETSQHPDYQEMLIKSLIDISSKDNCQVLLTTHVPSLAGLLPSDNLLLLKKENNVVKIEYGNDDILQEIVNTLGILPEPIGNDATGILLVEGKADVCFFDHISTELKNGGFITHSLSEKKIVIIPIGGCGSLKHWVTLKIAEKFGLPYGIILDSDLGTNQEPQRRRQIQDLVAQGKKAFCTNKRELENYLDVSLINSTNGHPITYTDSDDAKKIISAATGTRESLVLETYVKLMNHTHIRSSEKYTNQHGTDSYEFTEIFTDLLNHYGA